MSKLISVDNVLYQEVTKVKNLIKKNGCKNPSYSNAIRTMCDMNHISTKDRIDKCDKNAREYLSTTINLDKENKEEKELDG